MDALILSCSTGGGHHAAAEAVREEMERRGHHADILDPYTLSGKRVDEKVGNCYIKCVQKASWFFGIIYVLGNLYRRLPVKSPVYWANRKTADFLQKYLEEHKYDVILMTHIFPGEMLTYLKHRGASLPGTVYIATDYTCIPFTEELECDYFIIPSQAQKEEFVSWGIAPDKVIPIGIPVRRGFSEKMGREKAIEYLELNPEKRYILMAGGSIGAGKIVQAIHSLNGYLQERKDTVLIAVCGSNGKLYEKLKNKYGENEQILLLEKTEDMAEYLEACDLYISKPGGISSTEAAASNIPLIHISPIPGCETVNKNFFSDCGMSIGISDLKKELPRAVQQLNRREIADSMRKAQHGNIDSLANEKIVDFVEKTF